jgi:hypothetical protein
MKITNQISRKRTNHGSTKLSISFLGRLLAISRIRLLTFTYPEKEIAEFKPTFHPIENYPNMTKMQKAKYISELIQESKKIREDRKNDEERAKELLLMLLPALYEEYKRNLHEYIKTGCSDKPLEEIIYKAGAEVRPYMTDEEIRWWTSLDSDYGKF